MTRSSTNQINRISLITWLIILKRNILECLSVKSNPGFALVTFSISSLWFVYQNSRYSLKQWETNPKPLVAFSHAFSRFRFCLVYCTVCLRCSWLELLLWFWLLRNNALYTRHCCFFFTYSVAHFSLFFHNWQETKSIIKLITKVYDNKKMFNLMESNHSEWPHVKKIYVHKPYLRLHS